MKALIVFIACAGIAVGQTTPAQKAPAKHHKPHIGAFLSMPVPKPYPANCDYTSDPDFYLGCMREHSLENFGHAVGYDRTYYYLDARWICTNTNTPDEVSVKCVNPAPKPDAVTPAKVSGEYWGDTPIPEKDRHYSVEQFYGKLNVAPTEPLCGSGTGVACKFNEGETGNIYYYYLRDSGRTSCMPDEITEPGDGFGTTCHKHAPEKLDAVTPETTFTDRDRFPYGKTWKGDNKGDLTTQDTGPCTHDLSRSDEGCMWGADDEKDIPIPKGHWERHCQNGYTAEGLKCNDDTGRWVPDPVEMINGTENIFTQDDLFGEGIRSNAGDCLRFTASEGYSWSSCDAADPILDPVEAAKSGWSCTMTPKEILCVR